MNALHQTLAPPRRDAEGQADAGVIAGFENIRRYWDPAQGLMTAKLLPGEYYVSAQDEVLCTVLGSCISACIADPQRQIGGMNHFMLPAPLNGERGDWSVPTGRAARYGSDAMEQLINAILKAGGRRDGLTVKLFGGARVLSQMTDVGQRNIDFARRYLDVEQLPLLAEDLGDVYPRQVQFFPRTGRVRIRQLRGTRQPDLTQREVSYLKHLAADPIKGEVELF